MRSQGTVDRNHFELLGNIGRLRIAATPSGREVANLSIATHRVAAEPDSERLVELTQWHDVVAFDALASQLRMSARVGVRLQVSGYMRTRKWMDRDTADTRFKHELVATRLQVLESAELPETHPRDAELAGSIKITSF